MYPSGYKSHLQEWPAPDVLSYARPSDPQMLRAQKDPDTVCAPPSDTAPKMPPPPRQAHLPPLRTIARMHHARHLFPLRNCHGTSAVIVQPPGSHPSRAIAPEWRDKKYVFALSDLKQAGPSQRTLPRKFQWSR